MVLSEDLIAAPEATLRTLCSALGIPFDPAMLSWQAGPRPEDGCWAPWWYASTHKSTGFGGPQQQSGNNGAIPREPLPAALRPLLEECRPLYEMLRRRALRPGAELPLPHALPEQHDAAPATTPIAAGTAGGTHAHAYDPRNADVLVGIRDGVTGAYDLIWRPEAKVSVLDSGFMLGDGVWEGLRLHRGVLLFAQAHMSRLFEGAKALDMDLGLTPDEVLDLVYRCCDANGMRDGVHVRLMVTRGLKATPYQAPAVTIGAPTIVVLPEYKEADPGPKVRR